MSDIIEDELPEALDGERLDRVVAMLDGCSRAVAAALIDDGQVRIDEAVVTQRSFRVRGGSTIRFAPTQHEPEAVLADPAIDFATVHVDDDIIVVDKPCGLVVHPGAGRPDKTLVNGLLARFPDIEGVGQAGRPGLVHRLDADTSGLLVVARTEPAYDALSAAIARHDVDRVYIAVVDGVVADDRGIVDAPIGRSTQRRTRMAVIADGRPARTHYEVLERRHDDPACSLLRCRLETGRTHQIRVHLAAIGHAVLGDPTYGSRASAAGFDRVALHAEQLRFDHPTTGDSVSFHTPIPGDLRGLIDDRFGTDSLR